MQAQSRTKKSLKNSFVALSFYAINLILQFFSRKIFLDHLGTEILGLNTTATNLFQFLNLAELGIGSAVAFSLYKPLAQNDIESINEIVGVQGWLYKRIAYFIIGGAIILGFFFPLIFKKATLPLWYAYASFGVVLFSALLTYFLNYKQILFSADQKDYHIQYSYKTIMFIKLLVQIFAIKYFPYGYEIWIVTEVVFSIIASISLNVAIKKHYPYIRKIPITVTLIKYKYSIIIKKIKQLFFHKIGGFALTQSSSIIIYAYANLTIVALYGNYMVLVTALNMLINAVFNSMGGGIGNLVASSNKTKQLSIFNELFSIRFLIISTFCIGFYLLSPEVITFWIGKQYILTKSTVILIILTMFVGMSRITVDNFIFAYGAFDDIYAPIIEIIVNIGLSIWFGYYWGLNGILLGVLVSQILIISLWKPYFLFVKILRISIYKYIGIYSKNIISMIMGISSIWVLRFLMGRIIICENLLFKMSEICLYIIVCLISLIGLRSGINNFFKRIKAITSSRAAP